MLPEHTPSTHSYPMLRGSGPENTMYDTYPVENGEDIATIERLVMYKKELDERDIQIFILFGASLMTLSSCGLVHLGNSLSLGDYRANAIRGIVFSVVWYKLALMGVFCRPILQTPKSTANCAETGMCNLRNAIARLEFKHATSTAFNAGSLINALPTLIGGIVVLNRPELASETNKIAGFAFIAIFAATAFIVIAQSSLSRRPLL